MATDEAASGDLVTAPPSTRDDSWFERVRSERFAATVFGIYIGVSFFVLFHIGRKMWFYEDDWMWIQRRLTPSGLFKPFFQHWITLPLLAYHVLFWAFGAHYRPFQVCTIALHLVLAVLLRVVMRRAGVSPWIANLAAGAFVLFGAGHEGIIVSVQMSLVGSVVFGMLHLLCADHDGPFTRRDALGLAFGLLALMSSGIGTIMVVIVGLAVLFRRGWRMALIHTVPLALINTVWYEAERQFTSGTRSHSLITDAVRWNISGESNVFTSIGGYGVVGIALGVLLVVGLVVAWRSLPMEELRKRAAVPAALLLGGPVLFTSISIQRSYIVDYEKASRFLNLAVAFSLPALAVAADAVARRWRRLAPVVVALLLLGLVVNLGRFPPESSLPVGFFAHEKDMLLGAAYSPLADKLPQDFEPYAQLFNARGLTMGFLRSARRAGRLPPPPHLNRAEMDELRVRLGVEQLSGPPPRHIDCHTYYAPLVLTPAKGTVYVLDDYVAINPGTTVITGITGPVFFDVTRGRALKVLVPGLRLTVSNSYNGLPLPFSFCYPK